MVGSTKWRLELAWLACLLATLSPVATAQLLETDIWLAEPWQPTDPGIPGPPSHYFGQALAVEGDFAIVGASSGGGTPTPDDSVYVIRVSTGEVQSRLRPDSGLVSQGFGYAVALLGDYVLVGAPRDSVQGSMSGSAYLFSLSSGQQLQKWSAADGGDLTFFGRSVDLDGDFAIVGAGLSGSLLNSPGAAYVFQLSTGQQIAKVVPPDGALDHTFGLSVAIAGEVALVGQHEDDSNGEESGSLFLFQVFTGVPIGELIALDASQELEFGISVDAEGDLAVVGAWGDQSRGPKTGAAYLFRISTGQQLAKLIPNDAVAGDRFGVRVAMHGSQLVGSSFSGSDGYATAHLFEIGPDQELATLSRHGFGTSNSFGSALAISDDAVLIGCPGFQDGNYRSGATYVYDLSLPQNFGSGYCFGDGSGAACPCGPAATANEGCPNSTAAGGRLTAFGSALLSSDDFQLLATNLPSHSTAIAFRGLNQVNSGRGNPAGFGLLCTTGGVIRSQVANASYSGNVSFGDMQDQSFGSHASIGTSQNYQVWYEDTSAVCGGSNGFNFTNAWSVTWLP